MHAHTHAHTHTHTQIIHAANKFATKQHNVTTKSYTNKYKLTKVGQEVRTQSWRAIDERSLSGH